MPSAPERFRTRRLQAERLGREHVRDLSRLHADPVVMGTLLGVQTAEQTAQRIEVSHAHWEQHGFGVWALFSISSGEFVGRAGIRHEQIEGKAEIELLYAIHAGYWRQGLTTEAARAIVSIGLDRMRFASIIAFTLPTNAGSRGVMEKCGMTLEGKIVRHDLPHVLYRLYS